MAPSSLVIALLVLTPAVGRGQEFPEPERVTAHTLMLPAEAPRPAATLADVAWFTGQWAGRGLGGRAEEAWSAPAGGSMMGMFRVLKEDAIFFYEFFTLVEEKGSLVLRLKHFNADLTGWEEKAESVQFRLVTLTPTEAFFDGLTFRRKGTDALEIFVAVRNRKEGTVSEEVFRYERTR